MGYSTYVISLHSTETVMARTIAKPHTQTCENAQEVEVGLLLDLLSFRHVTTRLGEANPHEDGNKGSQHQWKRGDNHQIVICSPNTTRCRHYEYHTVTHTTTHTRTQSATTDATEAEERHNIEVDKPDATDATVRAQVVQ